MTEMMQSDNAFGVIELIANERGHAKFKWLHDGLLPYFKAAYDPYVTYYQKDSAEGHGEKQFTAMTWKILTDLSTRKLSGQRAKAVIRHHTWHMSPSSAELFNRILRKDLRMGLGAKSINKIYPGCIPTHDIMLAKLFDPKRFKRGFGSPKIDGVRAEYKNGEFYSRGGHIYKGLEVLKNELKDVTEPLDGELDIPGIPFQESSGLIRRHELTPNARFNIIELPEVKDDLTTRLMMIKNLEGLFPHVQPIYRQPLYTLDEAYSFYETCRDQGYEGAVVTPEDYEYRGTRSWDWMKMKPEEPIDLKVIDFYEGKGKYVGQLGGFVVDFNGTRVDVGGGYKDQERIDFWSARETYIGRTMEVLYMEVTDTGSLRHPRYNGFRFDK